MHMLKSKLVDKIFQTSILIGWQQTAIQSEAKLEHSCSLTWI